MCKYDLPLIDNNTHTNKKLASIFFGKTDINMVKSFLYYRKEGKVQQLIHHLKYKNREDIGSFLGNWFGHQLKEQKLFTNINYIVPVPLHPKKLKLRGYNQVTKFGISLSNILNIEYKPNILIRTSISKTQTLKQRFERFSNTNTKFKLTNIQFFENKHILLIDDVITTGATLEACCNELLKTKNITISIATLAYTEKT
ncbi:ComF family protein [Tenacibaculum holothuriorum]|nr:phosphoribosyltransferase family protein [Tenacibaculum holothuriorum]